MKKNFVYDSGGAMSFLKKNLLKMKLTILCLLLGFIQLMANDGFSQSTRITLNLRDARVEDVLIKIEEQSDLYFIYNREVVDVNRKVNVSYTDQKLSDILFDLFKGTNVTFEVQDRHVILKSSDTNLVQQQKSISGRVTDSSGAPLPGVTVVVKGTTQGVITNADGNYTLSKVPSDATLVFSFVGMKSQKIAVAGKSTIDVVMQEETIGLGEVVAIGYGTARKNDFTGSVTSVNIEDSPLASLPNINALESLRGNSPGLNIGVVNSAGETPDILVRGQNSINGSNTPLIVLNGVIYLGDINDINPNDIATFDILKDASSAAVYGSRAANGVIIITTKKGKSGKPIITVNSSIGASVWQQKPKLFSGDDYLNKVNTYRGIYDPLEWMWETEKVNYLKGIQTNWLDFISRIAPLQNHQISVSGGGTGINYYLSGGYTQQDGVLLGDDYDRISLNCKINTNITNWFQLGIDAGYNFSDYSGVGANVSNAMTMSPYGLPYRDEKNTLYEKYPVYQSNVNPLWGVDDGTIDDIDKQNTYRIAGYAKIDIPFIKGLSYRFNYVRNCTYKSEDRFYYEDYFISEGYGTDRYEPKTVQGYLSSAYGYTNRTQRYDYVFDNILSYKNEFNKHFVDATLVATRDYQTEKLIYTYGLNFEDNGNTLLGINGLMKASTQNISMENTEKANIGYLARLSYSYDDKYHMTASFRRDGSSVFGANKKWGNFSSIGIAWTASKENFIKNFNIINYLKIKASFGKNGNQGIGAYETLSKVTSGSDGDVEYEFSDSSDILYGLYINSLGNSLLGWETTTSFNGGIESSVLNKRVSFDFDFYFSKTTDQLFDRNIPPMTGFTSIKASMGQVNNRGVEINLKTKNIERTNWIWSTNFSFWQNRNVLKKLYGDDIDNDGKEDDDISNSLFIGKSLGAIYGYEFDGIVQEEDSEYMEMTGSVPGDAKFKDLNKDGKLDADNDRKILGYRKENFRLSMSNNLQYKNFELYVLISGIFGGGRNNYYIKSNAKAYTTASSRGSDNGLDHIWWTSENRSNVYPSITYVDNRFKGLQSRSFVRIQDITLSYNFNKTQLQYLKLNGLKIYMGIKNLYTFTNWTGGDPEEGVTAMSKTYPVATTYSLGLNISF